MSLWRMFFGFFNVEYDSKGEGGEVRWFWYRGFVNVYRLDIAG